MQNNQVYSFEKNEIKEELSHHIMDKNLPPLNTQDPVVTLNDFFKKLNFEFYLYTHGQFTIDSKGFIDAKIKYIIGNTTIAISSIFNRFNSETSQKPVDESLSSLSAPTTEWDIFCEKLKIYLLADKNFNDTDQIKTSVTHMIGDDVSRDLIMISCQPEGIQTDEIKKQINAFQKNIAEKIISYLHFYKEGSPHFFLDRVLEIASSPDDNQEKAKNIKKAILGASKIEKFFTQIKLYIQYELDHIEKPIPILHKLCSTYLQCKLKFDKVKNKNISFNEVEIVKNTEKAAEKAIKLLYFLDADKNKQPTLLLNALIEIKIKILLGKDLTEEQQKEIIENALTKQLEEQEEKNDKNNNHHSKKSNLIQNHFLNSNKGNITNTTLQTSNESLGCFSNKIKNLN